MTKAEAVKQGVWYCPTPEQKDAIRIRRMLFQMTVMARRVQRDRIARGVK